MVSICRHSSEVFPLQDDTIDSYWQRMLDGHLFDTGSDDINNFLTEYETQSTTTSYTDNEESVMNMLFPSDFSIRSLYDQVCIFDTIHHIINPRYKSSPSLTEARKNLSDDDSQWPIILSAFGDITYAKNDFWK